jgi:hypothetical protein
MADEVVDLVVDEGQVVPEPPPKKRKALTVEVAREKRFSELCRRTMWIQADEAALRDYIATGNLVCTTCDCRVAVGENTGNIGKHAQTKT